MILDVNFYQMIWTFKLICFTIQLLVLISNYGHLFQTFMKFVLVMFEILFTFGTINNGVTLYILSEQKSSDQFRYVQYINLYEKVSYSLFLVLTYKVLFVLKRVEFQMNTTFKSVNQVTYELRKLIIIERFYLFIYTGVIAVLMVYSV